MATKVSKFIIRELLAEGGRSTDVIIPEVFEWTLEGRSLPKGSWNFGGQLRTSRTDYPGGDRPTEQVLGTNFTPFTVEGRWQNKFNRITTEGLGDFAEAEMARFETMCRRGNLVEVTFENVQFTGLITNWTFDYKRRYDIGYSFTMSPHTKAGHTGIRQLAQASSETSRPPSQLVAESRKQMQDKLQDINEQGLFVATKRDLSNPAELSEAQLKQTFSQKGRFAAVPVDILRDSLDETVSIAEGIEELADVVNQRVLALEADTALGLSAAVTRTNIMINRAYGLATAAGGLKASADLLYRNPINELDFEVWNKGQGSFGRESVYSTNVLREELERRRKPDAIALYRPFEGETLYSISNRFYGNFRSWRLIFDRNDLTNTTMTGDELLVIPQAPKE